VLVVDDDAGVREAFRRVLQARGFRVLVASGGEEALTLLHDDPTVGLMLLDVEMPGIDGVAVRRAQLADTQLSSIPTVLVSGSPNVRLVARDLRVPEYLRKPVDAQHLLAVVRRYCSPEGPDTPKSN
jgi:CheY-like chemotaxis protein